VPVTETQSFGDQPNSGYLDTANEAGATLIPSGIGPMDERAGGLRPGGSYLIVGTPGPAKMVAAFQFLFAGLERGESALLLGNADEEASLGVARAWGFDFEPYWRDGTLKILGFKDDFELRAIRSVEPEEVLEELDFLAGPAPTRIAVDPGSLFLAGGVKSLLGSSFLKWARNHPATVCATFSVDGTATSLPSSADWLVHATTGRIVLEWRADDLYQLSLAKAVPEPGDREEAISVELRPGVGLVKPENWPTRRGRDRPGVDEGRLLLVSLGGDHAADVEAWASGSFNSDVVSEPFDAVTRVQGDPTFGGVLIHSPRARIREAVQACRALRPLTRAAIVFASDDAVRSTDRIQILEAGADDCLSGGIDFRELDLRIKQAIAAGSKPVPEAAAGDAEGGTSADGAAEGGRVSVADFAAKVERRASNPVLTFFCILDIASDAIEPTALEDLLVEHVRCDEGDLVSRNEKGCVVLLQGAREGQLEPFLARLRTRIDERSGERGAPDLALDVLSHPAESARIRTLLGIEGGSES
jgi:DNA-binding NarL/FixJ family response regulator